MCRTTTSTSTTSTTSKTSSSSSNPTAEGVELPSADDTTTTPLEFDYGSPKHWYVFIVGNCEYYPENRTSQGDIALHRTFLEQGVPSSQICYLKDEECTQHNCATNLEQFLTKISNQQLQQQSQQPSKKRKKKPKKQNQRQQPSPPDHPKFRGTFFFYYGGHGVPSGLCTLKNKVSSDDESSENNDDDEVNRDTDDDDSSSSSSESSCSTSSSSSSDWSTTWLYTDIVSCITSHYRGDRVVFLLDCCASGNLHRHLQHAWNNNNNNVPTTTNNGADCIVTTVSNSNSIHQTKNERQQQQQHRRQFQYVCITPTPPYIVATDEGGEWVVNLCWIRAMKCVHGIPPLATYMEFFADRLALVMGDQAVMTFSTDVDLNSTTWMPRRQLRPDATFSQEMKGQNTQRSREKARRRPPSRHSSTKSTFKTTNWSGSVTIEDDLWDEMKPDRTLNWPRLEHHIPPDAIVDNDHWTTHDTVYYKHKGGIVQATRPKRRRYNYEDRPTEVVSVNVPPCWLLGTIVTNNHHDNDDNNNNNNSDTDDYVTLRVRYLDDYEWTVTNGPRCELMNDLYMGHAWMLPDGIMAAQIRLAKNFKYIDFSFPAYETVHVNTTTTTTTSTITTTSSAKPVNAVDDDDVNKVGTSTPAVTKTITTTTETIHHVGRAATIVDWRDVDWHECLDERHNPNVCRKEPPFGPHVPIRWNTDDISNGGNKNDNDDNDHRLNDNAVMLIPVEHIVQPSSDTAQFNSPQHEGDDSSKKHTEFWSTITSVPPTTNERRHLSVRALVDSIESSGKRICHATMKKSYIDNDNNDDDEHIQKKKKALLSVYWPQDGEFSDSVAMDVNLPTTTTTTTITRPIPSLKVLARHVQFTLRDCWYCPVHCVEDGTRDLLPLHYVRPRMTTTTITKKKRKDRMQQQQQQLSRWVDFISRIVTSCCRKILAFCPSFVRKK